jgi:hypothetical protein
MDINLTGQILSMPIKLTGQVTSQSGLWDSQIIGVLVGGLIAYLATITTEEWKRQYEIKKETYFKSIEIILIARTIIPKIGPLVEAFLKKAKADKIPLTTRSLANYFADNLYSKWSTEPEILQNINAYNNWEASLEAIQFETKICGSKKVISEMRKWSDTIKNSLFENWDMPPESVADELISAMKHDLEKHWWQFWR